MRRVDSRKLIMETTTTDQPVVRSIVDFDTKSGSRIEQGLFNNRLVVLVVCLILTVVLGYQATTLKLNASFEKMIPSAHPFITAYLQNRGDLKALFPNAIRIAVETTEASIFDAHYLEVVQKINDDVFLLNGVDRPFMKSLWTPATRWIGVTEDGLDGGPVIPSDYNGSEESLRLVRNNVERSGEIGQIVAPDFKASTIFVPLLGTSGETAQALDYAQFAEGLEQIRIKYQSATIKIHITGFAKVVGDLMEGLKQILIFFAVAIIIASLVLYWYTRCVRSTLLVVSCSLVAVIWQLGLLPTLGFALDPYSVLVPFLVFAIGMSHGAQKMNGIMQDIGRGTDRRVAARYTFRRLFLAGLTALLCDAVGFAVLMIIEIKAIQDLAVIASIGVAVLIFTNLILLPILLSYTGVSEKAAQRSLKAELANATGAKHLVWHLIDRFTTRKWAAGAIIVSALIGVVGYTNSLNLKIGDLDAGAPELRPDSRYNRDSAFMTKSFAASSDVFTIMVKTPDSGCAKYDVLNRIDALEWQLRQIEGVDTTVSLGSLTRTVMLGLNEGSTKWYELLRTQDMLNQITSRLPPELFNPSCNMVALHVFLRDHKADTLTNVVAEVQSFAAQNNSPDHEFLLAAGNAGIEAATNIVVKQASREMLYWVYGAVILLCLITFRSWRAVVCAVVPLALTSILCEALMVWLNIGVKVATLPVIALGVGIGVDYALYVMSILLAGLKQGLSLSKAYYRALLFTGKVVMLTGITLAIGVATWTFSPIKFQADMGILLAFMFIWNMLGALILLPALAHFLLREQCDPKSELAVAS